MQEKIVISFVEAKALAEESAGNNLKVFLDNPSQQLLSDEYREAEHCWMFFRNKKIIIPAEGALRGEWAYVVGKLGEVRDVPDLSNDEEKLNAYLIKMSDYFGNNTK